jgi:acetyl-CoA C-acetyltransferase
MTGAALGVSARDRPTSLRGAAYVVGAFEHPGRHLPDRSLAQIHADVAFGALADAGLTIQDVDAYFCSTDAPGMGPLSMVDYLGLRCSYLDTTELGGSSYVAHVGHAAAAIAAGRCSVALITLGGKPRTGGTQPGLSDARSPDFDFEHRYGLTVPAAYALAARRHMHEYGTTSAQLAAVKVAASQHAQHNPNAFLRDVVTVDEVLASPIVADPLHRLDCCVITDGGGALVVVSPEVARDLPRAKVKLLGHGEAPRTTEHGRIDLTRTGAQLSAPRAFAEARVTPADIDYAGIYDSFTITVLETVEDLGFCEKGGGGAFVENGGLVAPFGRLPTNTDGGGLCNNHPGNRGGMTKVIETVRQLRGEAHPAVQVPDCRLALVHGTGGSLALRTGAATLILGAEDA